LIPTSELGTPRGADLRKLFPVGTELDAAVIAIDERGRIRLSILALKSADERREFETYAGAAREKSGDRNSGFGKLGDLLKKK
jgi:small subunit ribosomal protein S1